MNRRTLFASLAALAAAALAPWRRKKASREELQRTMELAVRRALLDGIHLGQRAEWVDLDFESRGGAVCVRVHEFDGPPRPLCTHRPGCPFPEGSLCGQCPISWHGRVANFTEFWRDTDLEQA